MPANAHHAPAEAPDFLRSTRRVTHVNGRHHEPDATPRRVRAGSAAGEPLSDTQRDALLADSELLDKVRQATEVKLAYQRGHRDGEALGLQAIKRSWFWSGVGFGTCVGSMLVFSMLSLGLGR